MNVVMLSGFDPSGRFMAAKLREAGVIQHVIRIEWTGTPGRRAPQRTGWERLQRIPGAVLRRAQGRFLDRHFRALDRALSRELFDSQQPPEVAADETVRSDEINGAVFAERLRALAPDLVIVNGAPILKEHIFSIPRLGMANVHFGIAPAYRGVSTLFWPMYHGDFDNIGVTLHAVAKGIDAGAVYSHAYPSLSASDTEASIMANCTRLATALVTALVHRAVAHGRLGGRTQPGKGRLFLKRDRQGWQDIVFSLKRGLGLTKLPERPPRIARYFEEAGAGVGRASELSHASSAYDVMDPRVSESTPWRSISSTTPPSSSTDPAPLQS
ncbi:formyl transferase [Haliangium ochraceum]|uniref:Formyl transferase domain protein n=1 Tax=Haliangium ochraceum (strain DSM 14365 / JCM 11303 / SMP-2) TaxID=502025 RepID=D0LKF7_HALO1|nr:formyl transferase [Haliangium ochraceum]ACY15005.1 formyl transferase domain protein [Haliangium ochraceum DSM 14365]